MEAEMKKALESAGMDVDSVMDRFMGNEKLLEKVLKKFIDDKNYKSLLEAIEAKDSEQAFMASHTLKGVCGNLSLMELFNRVDKQVEYFRHNEWEKGVAMMPEVTEEYQRVITMLKEIYQL